MGAGAFRYDMEVNLALLRRRGERPPPEFALRRFFGHHAGDVSGDTFSADHGGGSMLVLSIG